MKKLLLLMLVAASCAYAMDDLASLGRERLETRLAAAQVDAPANPRKIVIGARVSEIQFALDLLSIREGGAGSASAGRGRRPRSNSVREIPSGAFNHIPQVLAEQPAAAAEASVVGSRSATASDPVSVSSAQPTDNSAVAAVAAAIAADAGADPFALVTGRSHRRRRRLSQSREHAAAAAASAAEIDSVSRPRASSTGGTVQDVALDSYKELLAEREATRERLVAEGQETTVIDHFIANLRGLIGYFETNPGVLSDPLNLAERNKFLNADASAVGAREEFKTPYASPARGAGAKVSFNPRGTMRRVKVTTPDRGARSTDDPDARRALGLGGKPRSSDPLTPTPPTKVSRGRSTRRERRAAAVAAAAAGASAAAGDSDSDSDS